MGGLASSLHDRGANAQPAVAWHVRARHWRSLFPGAETQRSRFLRARAVPRWLWLADDTYKNTALVRGPVLRCKSAVRRASYGLQRPVGCREARAGTPLHSLYVGRRRNTRACYARAPRRANCGWFKQYESALHKR